ncbi:MAG TPA: PAS domain S-box protein, partial [Terriglobales bacterium]|nr:PAS domain S-box protein [Terriglobales bacterium]
MSTVSEAVPEISSWPSAGLLAAALASCPEAVAIVEAGIVLWCNPAHARLFGYDHAREVAGRSLADLLPKHFPCAQQPATTALNCGFPACRFHIAGNGSNERLLESSCREFRAEERRLLVIATRDITPQERRRISREGEARFRAIFEAAAIGIAHFTLDGKIVESNRALEQMLGYSHAELQGMPLVRITHPEDRAEDEHCFAEMTAGRKDQYQLEKRYVRKDGEVVWARLNVSLVRAPGGEPQFAIKLVENISERKRAEEALRESQKMEAVGRLVASLAHDFANLLTGVGILSDLLAVELRAQPGGQRAREIQLATEQGCALIRKLLFIARQHATDAKVLSLHTLVEDMRDLLAHLVEERCELTIGSEPAVGRVKADPAEMQQVVLNLVLNARDALPQGGHINLALGNCRLDSATAIAAAARPGEYVVLEVADDGCGMDENIRAHLFEPFFTTKPPGQGTGLGLATVKAIVNQSRGSIVVESAPGQGTRIRVLLPRVSGELQWNGSQAHDHPSLEGRETVLLVEDDERVRASIEQVLAKCGYRLLVAADGADALRIARRHHGPIHLLLLDMVMPGANGPEVARQIKPLHPQAKVLFISGYGLGSPEDGPESGIFRKPFTGGALARKIRET